MQINSFPEVLCKEIITTILNTFKNLKMKVFSGYESFKRECHNKIIKMRQFNVIRSKVYNQ